jgi:hypothetical protein
MGRKRRRQHAAERRGRSAAAQSAAATTHCFATHPADHCETSVAAYEHIAPVLRLLAAHKGVSPAALRIYDPYYCAGAVVSAAFPSFLLRGPGLNES